MIPGIRGRLVGNAFARDVLPSMPEASPVPAHIISALGSWAQRLEATLGTASSLRAITDVAVLPLLNLLGLAIDRRVDGPPICVLHLVTASSRLAVVVSEWGDPLDGVWRSSVIHAIRADARWCLCCNGRAIRLVDAQRTWSREYLEFEAA